MRRFRFTGLGLLVASQVVALLIAASVGFGARANSTSLHIQVVNRTKDDAVEVVLDGRHVYAGRPMPHSLLESNRVPESGHARDGGRRSQSAGGSAGGTGARAVALEFGFAERPVAGDPLDAVEQSRKGERQITFSMQRGPAGAR